MLACMMKPINNPNTKMPCARHFKQMLQGGVVGIREI